MSRYHLFLLFVAVTLIVTGCQTAAANEVLVGATASVAAIIAAVKPLLSPEQAAKLALIANNIDGTVQATATAVSTIVDVITSVKANATEQFTTIAKHAADVQAALASKPSYTEGALLGGGAAAVGDIYTNLSRNTTRAKALVGVKEAVAAKA